MIRRAFLGVGIIAIGFTAVSTASAEPGGYTSQDETFYRLLTEGSDSIEPMTITNFPLVRAQGLTACNRQRQGYSGLETVHMLKGEGPYSFDTASAIVSAAVVSYCREYLGF